MMVYEGETVIINCQSLKFPQPTRLWSKVNGVLPSKTRLHETDIGILTISDVQLSDKGIYNCTAKNPVGANSDTVKLEVYSKYNLFLIRNKKIQMILTPFLSKTWIS